MEELELLPISQPATAAAYELIRIIQWQDDQLRHVLGRERHLARRACAA